MIYNPVSDDVENPWIHPLVLPPADLQFGYRNTTSQPLNIDLNLITQDEIDEVANVLMTRIEDIYSNLTTKLLMELAVMLTASVNFSAYVMKNSYGIEAKFNIFDPLFGFISMPAVAIVVAFGLTSHLKRRSDQLKLLRIVNSVMSGHIRNEDILTIRAAFFAVRQKKEITRKELRGIVKVLSEGSEF
jgi:hypothetical protein